MSGHAPRFAVSAATTYHASFEEDVANCARAGIAGLGLWEHKLVDGSDEERAARLRDQGLTATFCFPLAPGIFRGNGLFEEPKDPRDRLDLLCASVRRFAAYRPEAVCILAGAPGAGSEAESWSLVVSAFKRVSEVAEDAGVRLALEVISPGAAGSLVPTISRALELIADVGAANLGILLDTWHSADEPPDEITSHVDRIAGIQVCDRTPESRGRFDRALPGRGVLPVEQIIRTAEAAGYDGWYELEILSDDGTFGDALEHSLWRQPPLDVLRAGRAAFEDVYARAVASR